jgi:hypothetical protein
MSSHSTDSIVRVAQAGGGPLILGGSLSTDSIVRIVQSTTAPVTVKAEGYSTDSLALIAQTGGSRVTIDFS